jgi:hypothetical protein
VSQIWDFQTSAASGLCYCRVAEIVLTPTVAEADIVQAPMIEVAAVATTLTSNEVAPAGRPARIEEGTLRVPSGAAQRQEMYRVCPVLLCVVTIR